MKTYKTEFTDDELKSTLEGYIPTEEEIDEDVIGQENKLQKLFESIKALKPLYDDFVDTLSLIKDSICGAYSMPFNVIAALAGGLLYVLSPVDLVPDVVPLLGFLDDAAVFAFLMRLYKKDLDAYRAWKASETDDGIIDVELD